MRSKANENRTIAEVTKDYNVKDAVPYPEINTLF